MDTPFLVGDRIYLRPVEMKDLDRCTTWINDPEVNRFLLVGRFPFNRIKEEGWIRSCYTNENEVNFALCIKDGDRHIGVTGLERISWVDRYAYFGIVIGEPDHWGQGYGTEALNLLLEYGFQTLNLNRVELEVYDFNTRAIKCYEQIGFVKEGELRNKRFRQGKYCNEYLMAILKEDWEKNKGE